MVLITGASKGIGQSILEHCLHEGYDCIVIGRDCDYMSIKYNITVYKCDLTNHDEVRKICSLISKLPIDTLINNAGGASPTKFLDIDANVFISEVYLNLVAPVLLSQAVLPNMLKNNYGRIINISSISAKQGTPLLFSYSAAKAGLNSITQSLARHLIGAGITVNAICPGGVDTETSIRNRAVMSQLLKLRSEEYQSEMIRNIGLNRLLKPSEIAEVVLFLMSAKSSFISGQCINVCGTLEVV